MVAPPGVDDAGLQTLYERGLANGAQVELVEGRRLRFLEPALRTIDRALFTPDTASVDPVEIMDRLKQELESLGVEIRVSTGMVRAVKKAVQDEAGNLYRFSHLFNCAGLHADRLARQFGFSEKYQILPFKGLYLKQSQGIAPLQRHLYPLPDLRFPFLGVHWTVGVDGGVKIGPNALPAWGRENYKGKEGFSWSEALKILLQQANLYLSRAEFRDLADQALASMGKKALFKAACQLLGNQPEAEFDQWYRPGIRAQLVDQEKGQLVQDFVVEGDTHSTHVLNAVSPGFTCALPFTQWIVEQVDDSKGPSWAKS